MNTQDYFTGPELSEKLEKLGIESQFDYYWFSHNGETMLLHAGEFAPSPFEGWYSRFQGGDLMHWLIGSGGDSGWKPKAEDGQKAYHFSDLLLPENAKKIFLDKTERTCDKCDEIILNDVGTIKVIIDEKEIDMHEKCLGLLSEHVFYQSPQMIWADMKFYLFFEEEELYYKNWQEWIESEVDKALKNKEK